MAMQGALVAVVLFLAGFWAGAAWTRRRYEARRVKDGPVVRTLPNSALVRLVK